MEFHKDLMSIRYLIVVALIIVALNINLSQCLDTTETTSPETDLAVKEDQNSLSLSNVAWKLWNWLTSDLDDGESAVASESRTFGKIRRLQMALIPIVFKFGIMSAMITVLVFLSLKTVFLLKALLFLNAGTLLAKLLTLKSQFIPSSPPQIVGYHSSWSPPEHGGWTTTAQHQSPSKEIHLHIHNSGAAAQQYGWQNRADPYSAHAQLIDASPSASSSIDPPSPSTPVAVNRKAVYGLAYYRPS